MPKITIKEETNLKKRSKKETKIRQKFYLEKIRKRAYLSADDIKRFIVKDPIFTWF